MQTAENCAQSKQVQVEGAVRLPSRLTAENGAKALLIGEFNETIDCICPNCLGDEEKEGCFVCNGVGTTEVRVPVQWETIKQIYAKIVANLAT